jgi:cell division initiation protein
VFFCVLARNRWSLSRKKCQVIFTPIFDRVEKSPLLQAHQYGEEAKSTAERESELILREAKFEANNIIRQTEDKAEAIRQEVMILQHEKERFIAEYRALLHAQLKVLSEAEQHQALDYSKTEVAKGLNEITLLENSDKMNY